MIIDCDTCVVRGAACQECVVTVLLGAPPEVRLDAEEQRAVDTLAEAGLVARDEPVSVVPPAPVRPVEWLVERHSRGRHSQDHRRSAERSRWSAERSNRQAG